MNVEKTQLEIEAHQRGLKVITIKIRRGYNLAGALKLVRAAHNEMIDLFHSHGYKGDILLGSVPRRFRKIPVVRTLHGWTSTKKISKIWSKDKYMPMPINNPPVILRAHNSNIVSFLYSEPMD